MENQLLYAEVCVLTLADFEDKLFTYIVPDEMRSEISKGSVVTVPFGFHNRLETAVVCSLCDKASIKNAKLLNGFFDHEISVSEELFELCGYIKDTCFCSLAMALKTILPPGTKLNRTVLFSINKEQCLSEELTQEQRQLYDYIAGKKSVSEVSVKKHFTDFFNPEKVLSQLIKKGYVVKSGKAAKDISDKTQKLVSLNTEKIITKDCTLGLSESAKRVLELLCENNIVLKSKLLEQTGVSASVLNTLEKRGIVTVNTVKKERNPYGKEFFDSLIKTSFSLSEEQNKAFSAIRELLNDNLPHCALLYGVTGSGKTNVCLSVIDEAIEQNKGVIVLVPEIALTAQTVSVFASRYGSVISVLHSGLSDGQRRDAFLQIKNKKSRIVIGTRSAIFAPVDNLGLVVIDEEQESSFKSDMTPKYHARDIARFRCAKNNALLVLCSATPSVESMYKAKSGVYSLVTMKNRYGKAKLPEVEICDMRAEPKYLSSDELRQEGNNPVPNILGKRLASEISNNLAKSEQSILLMNRRGYRSFSVCYKCGDVIKCPHCSVSLTFHKGKGKGKLMCHYCGYTTEPKSICPTCGSEYMGYMGSGTEMLEESLKRQFPTSEILRMDADTVSGQMTHEKILKGFRNKEADILVGTQMIAKGHDFPSVSLVGVINADNSLFLDDYRANERTFSLLTQVIGRAGRAEIPGRAMIQTYNPENETIRLSAAQDYDKFYEGEINLRKAAVFPPFCDILTIKLICETERDARNMAQSFGQELDKLCKEKYNDVKLALYGPFEDTIFKMAGKFRMKYVIKCRNSKRTRELISLLCGIVNTKYKNIGSVSADMNPTTV